MAYFSTVDVAHFCIVGNNKIIILEKLSCEQSFLSMDYLILVFIKKELKMVCDNKYTT